MTPRHKLVRSAVVLADQLKADDFVIQFIQNYKPRPAADRAAARAAAAKTRDAARPASAAGARP